MSEATSIDKLSIEIVSNSAGAAKGIDELAASLMKLKGTTISSTAVKNLNNLSDALKKLTPVASNANKLSSLADAISKLSHAGSIATVINQLSKLPGAVKGLSDLKIDDTLAEKANGLATALIPLSNIKTGGLGSMINSLAKIGQVTDSLDGETIAKFAGRVKELNTVLEPLSNKMTTIQMGLRGMNNSAKTAGNSVKDLGRKVNVTTLNLANMVTSVQGIVSALTPLVRLFSSTISEAMEWDGVAARFGRGFGDQADEVYSWVKRLNEEMGINTQQFMQYSSVFSTMLQGFGVGLENSSKMAIGYTELVYDIWAGYNDIYKTYGEAADAVKSAIAGEVEPIRRAGFTIVESTLKQTAANHGLEISLEKATEAQKSYLRYLTLVEQAQTQSLVGTYAKEMNTAEGAVRTFTQQLKTLKQAFGSLFLPLLVEIMPYLSAFIELLADAVHWVAALFGVKIQPINWGDASDAIGGIGEGAASATDSLNDATKAAEQLKNATLGIDELNVISPPSKSGGSGGGGGASGFEDWDIETLWDEEIFKNVKQNIEDIKSKIEEWLPVVAGVATALAGLKLTKLLEDVDLFDGKLSNLGKVISTAGISIAVGKLVWDFTEAYLEDGDWMEWLKALGTTAIGTGLAWKFVGKGGAGFVLTVSGIAMLSRLAFDLSEGNVDFGDTETWVTMITGAAETVIGGVITWKVLAPIIKPLLTDLATSIGTWLSGGGLAAAGSAAWPVAVAAAIAAMIALAFVDYDFTDIGKTVGEKVGNAIKWAFDNLTPIGLGKKFLGWIKDELDLDSVKEAVAALFDKETWTEVIFPKIGEIFKGIGEWFKDKFENLAGNLGEFQSGVLEGLEEAFDVDLSDFDFLVFKDAGDMFASMFPGTFFGNLGKKFFEKFSPEIKGAVEKAWGEAKKWWSSATIGEQAEVAIKLVKDGWKSVKEWVGSIPALSQYIKLVKDNWSTVKKWIGSIPAVSQGIKLAKSGWSTIKKWVGSIPAVSQAVKLAKSGWSSVKGWIGSMPTLSAGIKLVKSGWSSIKNWLGSLNFDLKFKLPKIKVNWGTKEVLGFKITYPTGFSTYAKGGFPDMGELFVAREAGPELVGKIGNRTTVANNEQIVKGISEGVYGAVLAAMRASESNGTQAVNVYLDGRLVTQSVEKRQHERGAAIMGRQVYSY